MNLKIHGKNTQKFKDFVVLNFKKEMTLSSIATLLNLGTSTLARWKDNKVYTEAYKEQTAEVEKWAKEALEDQVETLKIKYAIGLLFRKGKTLNQIKAICGCLEKLEKGESMNPNKHEEIYKIIEDTARTANLGVINFVDTLVSLAKKIKEGT